MNSMTVAGYQFDPDMAMILAEKAAMVLGILLATWILAKAAKWAFAKLVDTISFFRRGTSSGESVGMMLGRVVSLLVWLFGLVAILNVLSLGSVTGPVENMLTSVLDFVPNLIGAGIIFFVGSMIAKIVKELVETAMMTIDLDKWANKGGVETVTGNATISKTIGTIVYVLIIIPVAVAALQALQIESISAPLVNMLTVILNAIPNIIGAAIILGLGYVLARWVANLVQDILPGLGVDHSVVVARLLSLLRQLGAFRHVGVGEGPTRNISCLIIVHGLEQTSTNDLERFFGRNCLPECLHAIEDRLQCPQRRHATRTTGLAVGLRQRR